MLNILFEQKADSKKVTETLREYGVEVPEGLRERDFLGAIPVAVAELRNKGKKEEAAKLLQDTEKLKEVDVKRPKWRNIVSIAIPIVIAIVSWTYMVTKGAWAAGELKKDLDKVSEIVQQQVTTTATQAEIMKKMEEARIEREAQAEKLREERREVEKEAWKIYTQGVERRMKEVEDETKENEVQVKTVNKKLDRIMLQLDRLQIQLEKTSNDKQ